MKIERDIHRDESRVVVLGLGNVLLGDEGLGVHALRILEQRFAHPRVQYVDGGTRGLLLLPFMEGDATGETESRPPRLLILDAVRADGQPGTILEFADGDLLASLPVKLSVHDLSLTDLLALLHFRDGGPRRSVRLLGMIPESTHPSAQLSVVVRQALLDLVDRAEAILREWLDVSQDRDRTRSRREPCVSEFPDR